MNAKQLDRYRHKPYLRELFLGDRLRACIDESKLVDGDFVYSFPKVFIKNRIIQGNWFTRNLACEKVTFSSSLEEKECYDTVIGFFVELYDNNLKTRYGKAEIAEAIMKLRESRSTAEVTGGSKRRRMK